MGSFVHHNLFTSEFVGILNLSQINHLVLPVFCLPSSCLTWSGDGSDADEEVPQLYLPNQFLQSAIAQVGEVQLLQCPVNENLSKYLEDPNGHFVKCKVFPQTLGNEHQMDVLLDFFFLLASCCFI